MKVKIFQDSIVFVSELSVEDIQKAKKFTPNALVLNEVDEDSKKKIYDKECESSAFTHFVWESPNVA